jgi:hypothetical protein
VNSKIACEGALSLIGKNSQVLEQFTLEDSSRSLGKGVGTSSSLTRDGQGVCSAALRSATQHPQLYISAPTMLYNSQSLYSLRQFALICWWPQQWPIIRFDCSSIKKATSYLVESTGDKLSTCECVDTKERYTYEMALLIIMWPLRSLLLSKSHPASIFPP